MKDKKNATIQELFHEATQLSRDERTRFLTVACAGDDQLRGELDRLLDAEAAAAGEHAGNRRALENEAPAKGAMADPAIGEAVGAYRMVELIGSGGMGNVYRAVRVDAEYDKCVAVKRISARVDTARVAARFRAERQILANLEHSNIARMLDGGVAADGTPYLIMEYVEGEGPMTYCRRHGLTLRQRLALFREICGAVHYAHQHMVVHRDLKPGNILVTAEGVPKLLDFGIAKILTPGSESDTDATETHTMTARYASPEQVRCEMVTTSTDIYSLGVILYELLTDRLPYRDPHAPTHELLRAVCEEESPRPSSYARELRGDLDNIILKALRKNPAERYASVDQFSEDIRLYLEGRPVLARGDSFSYVATKLIRRNKIATSAAAIVLVTLVVGFVMVNRERAKAEARFNDVRELAHSVIYDYHDAIERLPGSTAVRAQLVKDAQHYLEKLSAEADTPDLEREIVEAYVRISRVQGDTYGSNLGDTAGAMESAKKAVSGAEKLLAHDQSPATLQAAADAFSEQASLLFTGGKLDDASKLYWRAIEMRQRMAAANPDDIDNGIELTVLYSHVGDLYGGVGMQNLGKTGEAEGLYERADDTIGKLAMRFPSNLAIARERFEVLLPLSSTEAGLGHVEHAQKLLEQALAEIGKVAAANPNDANARFELANTEVRLGTSLVDARKAAEAIPHMAHSAALVRALADADPQSALYARSLGIVETQWAAALRVNGDAKAALVQNRNAIALATKLIRSDPTNTDNHADLGIDERKMGETLLAAGNAAEAVATAKDAEAILCANREQSNSYLQSHCGRAYAVAGNAELKLGHLAAAVAALQQAAQIASSTLQKDPANAIYRSDLGRAQSSLAVALARSGHVDDAKAAFESATQNWAALRAANSLTAEDAWRAEEAAKMLAAAGVPEPRN